MIAESSTPPAVCHSSSQKASGDKTKSNEEVKQKSGVGKGGRIVDTLRDLMADKNWRESSDRKDFWSQVFSRTAQSSTCCIPQMSQVLSQIPNQDCQMTLCGGTFNYLKER